MCPAIKYLCKGLSGKNRESFNMKGIGVIGEQRNDGHVWKLVFCIFLFCLPICTVGKDSMVFPGEDWQIATPENHGIDAVKLYEAIDYLHTNSGGVGANETVIVRNGYLIWQGSDVNNIHEIYSCTKTFTSTVLGILAKDGILSINDKANKYFHKLDDKYPEYAKIRLDHLATMTSGYDSIVGDAWKFYNIDRSKHHKCVLSFTTPGPPLFIAGKSFKYHDPAVHILGYILTQAAGESLEQIFRKRIADQIGMRHFAWSNYGYRDDILFNNPAGTPGKEQGGIYSSPRDLARYGLLYLNRGNWNGRQLLDTSFVERATSTQVPAEMETKYFDLTGRYGFFWWTNGIMADGTRPWPSAPPKTFAAHGAGRNFIFVIPEWSMVIVRLSPAPDGHINVGTVKKSVWEKFFSRLKYSIKK
jgi:CubicO group peptidase (beta-lactamase class C family)